MKGFLCGLSWVSMGFYDLIKKFLKLGRREGLS